MTYVSSILNDYSLTGNSFTSTPIIIIVKYKGTHESKVAQ